MLLKIARQSAEINVYQGKRMFSFGFNPFGFGSVLLGPVTPKYSKISGD